MFKARGPEAQMLKQRAGRFSTNKVSTGFRFGTLIGLLHYIVICIYMYETHVSRNTGPRAHSDIHTVQIVKRWRCSFWVSPPVPKNSEIFRFAPARLMIFELSVVATDAKRGLRMRADSMITVF